mmetsp:Transcript_10081/g.15098  ORF Transcript_10081/g.15098 Transcript_10081/m.15098 type:complete len:82 (+) Transcript_10081:550-795(+)
MPRDRKYCDIGIADPILNNDEKLSEQAKAEFARFFQDLVGNFCIKISYKGYSIFHSISARNRNKIRRDSSLVYKILKVLKR